MTLRRPDEDRSAALAETFALAGIGLLLAGLGMLALRPRPAWPVTVLATMGGVGLVVAAVLRRRRVVAVLRGRGLRSGSGVALAVALAIGIAASVNYLAMRHHLRWDLTRSHARSLSPETQAVLWNLRRPVELLAFYSQERDPVGYQAMRDLLRQYESASPQVRALVVDPDQSPGLTRRHDVTSYSTVVIQAGPRREELFSAGEQEITAAVLRLTASRRPKLFFIQGHGEHDPDALDPDGYSSIRDTLAALGYDLRKLWLAPQGAIPANCDVLIIAGPRQPYSPAEIMAVNDYLDHGGKALVLVDPAPEGEALDHVLAPHGIQPLPGVVIEPKWNLLGDASSVTVAQFEDGGITRPFLRSGRSFIAAFVLARALEREPERADIEVRDLLLTSANSWLESDFHGEIRHNRDERQGPFTIAAAITGRPAAGGVTHSLPQMRLVVIGDSDFIANGFIANGVNKDLLVNSVGWLAQADQIISIQPKPANAAPILLTPTQARIVFVISLILMPMAAIIAGAVVWWRRR